MKSIYSFLLLCMICNYTLPSQRRNHTNIDQSSKPNVSPVIKELDYFNQQEIDGVCALFDDKHTQNMLHGTNQDDVRSFLKDYENNTFVKEKSSRIITYKANPFNQVICGILTFSQNKDTKTAQYDMIVVDKNYRNRGIASSLMSHVQQFYIDPSIEKINLDVHLGNNSAIRCYEKQGFYTPIQTQFNNAIDSLGGYKDDEINFKMRKDLQPLSCFCPYAYKP